MTFNFLEVKSCKNRVRRGTSYSLLQTAEENEKKSIKTVK